MMTATILIALVISCAVLIATTIATTIATINPYNSKHWSPEEASKEDLKELEISRQLEIERQKTMILRKLGKTEPPVFANASRHRLPKHVIQMWMDYESLQPPAESQENVAQLVIFPRNRKFGCRWNGSSSCRRFEFVVPPDVLRSPSELSVRRLNGDRLSKVTVCVFYSQQRHEREKMAERRESVVKAGEDRWMSFRLDTFEKVKFWTENVTFAVEVAGLPVDDVEPNLPFLNMRKDMEAQSRERRSNQTTNNRNRGCHKVPFNISFVAIGYGDWIVHPPSYEANICKGYCQHVQNHHENFIDHLFQLNKTLEQEYGRCWSTCCRPKKFATLSMIYRDSEDTYVQTNMTDMIVTDCSCT